MFGKRRIPREERELRAYAETLTQEERYDAFADYLDEVAEENGAHYYSTDEIRRIYAVGRCFLMGYFSDILKLMSRKLGIEFDRLMNILP